MVESTASSPATNQQMPAQEQAGTADRKGKGKSRGKKGNAGANSGRGSGDGGGGEKDSSKRRAYTRTRIVDVEADQARLLELEGAGIKKLAGQSRTTIDALPEEQQELVREFWRIQGRLAKRTSKVQGQSLTSDATVEETGTIAPASGDSANSSLAGRSVPATDNSNNGAEEEQRSEIDVTGIDRAATTATNDDTTTQESNELGVNSLQTVSEPEEWQALEQQTYQQEEVVAATDGPFSVDFNSN